MPQEPIDMPAVLPADPPPATPPYTHIPASRLKSYEVGAWILSIIAYPDSVERASFQREAERFRAALVDAHLQMMGSTQWSGWEEGNKVFDRGWKKLEHRYLSGVVVTRRIRSD